MWFRSPAVVAVSLLAVVMSLVPATGCGSRKRKPPTIAELLDRARAAGSDEAQAKELTRVARLQLRSGNKSGASKTLSEARSKLSPSKPRKPKPQPAAGAAPTARLPPRRHRLQRPPPPTQLRRQTVKLQPRATPNRPPKATSRQRSRRG